MIRAASLAIRGTKLLPYHIPFFLSRDVLITTGAASALFIVATSLLGPADHLVVVRPNYATNLETSRVIGCAIDFVDVTFETALFVADFMGINNGFQARVGAMVTHGSRSVAIRYGDAPRPDAGQGTPRQR